MNCFNDYDRCKIKGVFDYYYVMNNWHWRLLVLIFRIYLRSGFGDDWILTGDLQVLLIWVRSDLAGVAGQTGVYRAVRPAQPAV